MNISGWGKYIPLYTPALNASSNEVDVKLLRARLVFVSLTSIAISAIAVCAKIDGRRIAKFVALPATVIFLADMARSLFLATLATLAAIHNETERASSIPILPRFPLRNENLAGMLEQIMALPEEERRVAVYDRLAFNSDKWELCLGEGTLSREDRQIELNSLPMNIAEILNSNCQAFPGRKVIDTHILVRIPKSLGEEIGLVA